MAVPDDASELAAALRRVYAGCDTPVDVDALVEAIYDPRREDGPG